MVFNEQQKIDQMHSFPGNTCYYLTTVELQGTTNIILWQPYVTFFSIKLTL